MNDSQRHLSEMENLDEKIIETKPWAKHLLKTTVDLSKKAVLNWCNIISKIGETDVDINQYTSIFTQQVTNLFEEMIVDLDAIQEKSLIKIENLLRHLQNLCKDLHVEIPVFDDYDKRPLSDLRKDLIERIEEFEKLANIRRKEVRDLAQKQMKLCQSLGREPLQLQESPLPLPEDIENIRTRIDTLETEAMEREERFFQLREEIVEIVNEFKIAPNLDFEREILQLGKNEVRITDADMEQLQLYYNKLTSEAAGIKEEVNELRSKVDDLWNKLEVDIAERDFFVKNNAGNSVHTLAGLKVEAARLDELKKANLKTFILKQREELNELWNCCHCSEQNRTTFGFYYSDCFNEDLFELHDIEIKKWKRFHAENLDIFDLLDEHKKLWHQHLQLKMNSGGANRYRNRGGQLLTEEKRRNKLKKRIPSIEQELLNLVQNYYLRTGQNFLTFGRTVQDYIDQLHSDEDKEFKLKLSAKKQQREQASTVGRSRVLFPPISPLNPTLTPRNASKRKVMATPSTEPFKKLKVISHKKAPKTGMPKLSTSINKRRRSSRGKKKLFKGKENHNATSSTDYDDFEKEVSNKSNCRSTTFILKEHNANTISATPTKHARGLPLPPKFVLTTPHKSEKILTPRENIYVSKTPGRK